VFADAGGAGDDLLKVPGQHKEHRPLDDEDDPDLAHAGAVLVDVSERHANRVLIGRTEGVLAKLPQPPAWTTLMSQQNPLPTCYQLHKIIKFRV
jgi:hypothetical protein